MLADQNINHYPETKWITSNPEGYWHVGLRHESRGLRTGKLMSVYYKTACSGRQLGGPWGQTERNELPANAGVCPRCQAILNKRNIINYEI